MNNEHLFCKFIIKIVYYENVWKRKWTKKYIKLKFFIFLKLKYKKDFLKNWKTNINNKLCFSLKKSCQFFYKKILTNPLKFKIKKSKSKIK